MDRLRAHQRALWGYFEAVQAVARPLDRHLGLDVVCGGGKQGGIAIAVEFLLRRLGVVDKVCWVTPNESLALQAVESVTDSFITRVLGHGFTLYNPKNSTTDPSRGGDGYTINYQSVCGPLGTLHAREFARFRYLLVLDEAHHLREDGEYARKVRPLVERAAVVLYATGTPFRGDRRPIDFFQYDDGMLAVDDAMGSDIRWFRYSLRDAYADKAIVNPDFVHVDGSAEYLRGGEEHAHASFRDARTLRDTRSALHTALNTEYSLQVLHLATEHWQAYRAHVYGGAKHLVICATIGQARRALGALRDLGVHDAQVAVYDEDQARNQELLARFRNPEPGRPGPSTLVTVNMAYEGLDCQSITHVTCLTRIRSEPWIRQAFARGWRTNYAPDAPRYRDQRCFIFIPDDRIMHERIAAIRREVPARPDVANGAEPVNGSGGGGGFPPATTPIRSDMGAQTRSRLFPDDPPDDDGGDGHAVAGGLALAALASRHGISGDPRALAAFVGDLGSHGLVPGATTTAVLPTAPGAPPAAAATPGGMPAARYYSMTPERKLRTWRTHLDDLIGRLAAVRMVQTGETIGAAKKALNHVVKERFKPRDDMREDDFRAACAWVVAEYGSADSILAAGDE